MKKVASVFAAILVVVLLFRFITSGSHGYCERDRKYHTDEEFIKAALASQIVFIAKLDDPGKATDLVLVRKLVTDYLVRNPDCCKVFRETADEVRDVGWMVWKRGAVVVKIRDEESLSALRSGKRRIVDTGLAYVIVDNCFYGTEILSELTPGG